MTLYKHLYITTFVYLLFIHTAALENKNGAFTVMWAKSIVLLGRTNALWFCYKISSLNHKIQTEGQGNRWQFDGLLWAANISYKVRNFKIISEFLWIEFKKPVSHSLCYTYFFLLQTTWNKSLEKYSIQADQVFYFDLISNFILRNERVNIFSGTFVKLLHIVFLHRKAIGYHRCHKSFKYIVSKRLQYNSLD